MQMFPGKIHSGGESVDPISWAHIPEGVKAEVASSPNFNLTPPKMSTY
jgi:hypothetical protein